ncbi:hypothetical protein [Lentibacillus amyloliquefaciens]|uniref:LexA repressor DNA-binding domain-containing protein n=1 Tax=Lentibacillus amyloliquefaciens TaxID=1472767 RepID=A0A0U4EGV6_9BACI|nr:hypothetical protein [Lentibacillus amyloliquefaciens]ALX49737.1 hypothetical protein AOX59_14845 [Lentibacillus amyloliquefaciens]
MQLSDFERKLVTILKHNNKKGKVPSIRELEVRSGHSSDEIQKSVNDLINRNWIEENNGEWIVKNKLF